MSCKGIVLRKNRCKQIQIDSEDGIGDEKNDGQNAKYKEGDWNEYQEGNRGGREEEIKMDQQRNRWI